MTNAEVFSAFARREGMQGGSVRSIKTDRGSVLYSYSTPIAVFVNDTDVPVFTTRRFSVTTSKQQSQAKAIAGAYREVDAAEFKSIATKVGASFTFAR